jgi:cytochrome c-type biogenesis protein CcmH
MRRWKSSFLLPIIAVACVAQTASNQQSLAYRIGDKLACLCGACNNTVATCPMLECHFARPAKDRIAREVAAGRSEAEIIAGFKKDYGLQILAAPPAEGFHLLGYVMPFIAIALGLMAIWLFIKRFRKAPAVASGRAADEETLARYREQIEKDTSKFDQ